MGIPREIEHDQIVLSDEDEQLATRNGLGMDPAWVAARERVQNIEWIDLTEDDER